MSANQSPVPPTRHVDHPTVAVLHQVSRLAVDPTGGDAVGAEEVGVHRRGLAVPPRRRQVRQLGRRDRCNRAHLYILFMHLTFYQQHKTCYPVYMRTCYMFIAFGTRMNLIRTQWGKHMNRDGCCGSSSPTLLLFLVSLSLSLLSLYCPLFMQELNGIRCVEEP